MDMFDVEFITLKNQQLRCGGVHPDRVGRQLEREDDHLVQIKCMPNVIMIGRPEVLLHPDAANSVNSNLAENWELCCDRKRIQLYAQ